MTGDAVMPLVGRKMMRKLGGIANENAAAEISTFARRQMEMMGWSAGKGLGKNEQGITSHVKVKRREELQGVGAEKEEMKEQQNQWWYNVYDRMASKIVVDTSLEEVDLDKEKKKTKKVVKKDKRKRNENKGETYRIPTDEELFAATGGKLFGRRAYGSCNGKLRRDEMQLKKAKTQESQAPMTTTSGIGDVTENEKERKRVKKEAKKLKKKKTKKAGKRKDL
ncbi:unnamed protein product [Peronospora belbahrii]|uniref:G-patch domain-containing protein n=1 Tax=Peronospora belbahrii TaxID=622444 RepID=A0AAU9L1N9_9STRA|nr:unnamed protein product [Peronospora belbahrii]CAH0478680.1 unnamed protein product [Peronospora belbahrii]CAH0478692.1 unnamed protein product [Peronospora belbahrii]CAH0514679.1 unnamed protein product [Peronospora belbahrii]